MAARAGLSVQCKFCQSVKKIKNVHNLTYQLSYLTEPVSVPPVTSFSPPEASPTVLEGGSYNVTCLVSANPPTQVLLSSSHHDHHHLSKPHDCQAIPLFPQIPARGPTPQMSPGFCLFQPFPSSPSSLWCTAHHACPKLCNSKARHPSSLLTCQSNNCNSAQGSWVRGSTGEEAGIGPVLNLRSVSRHHGGAYNCIATNPLGSSDPRTLMLGVQCE